MNSPTIISIVTCGAALVSAIASIIAIASTAKANRFSAYFTSKSNAYCKFIEEFSKWYFERQAEGDSCEIASFPTAYYQACLFAPEAVYKRLSELVQSMQDEGQEAKEKTFMLYNDSINAMKADLVASESGKLFKKPHLHY